MEYDFCIALHKKLKEKIKGKIFTRVFDDKLVIRIDMDDLWFETSYEDFARRVIFGLTTDYIVYEVLEKYRRFLLHRMERYYFVQEQEELGSEMA